MMEKADVVNNSASAELFALIGRNDIPAVKQYLGSNLKCANDLDEHGMTPLEHAAYKGNQELCQILLDMGGTVTGGNSDNGYTALHFASLSGNSGLCHLLMERGAKAHALNSIGRTAAQMAALVGNHKCVSVINTFVHRKDVVYFSVPHELETSPKLNPVLVSPLHNLVTQVNFHPVRVALTVKKNDVFLDHLQEVVKVLQLMAKREIKKGVEANEIVAIKIHLLSHILGEIGKEICDTNGMDQVDNFVKKMLKCKEPGGIPEALDILFRKGVQSFPFHETTIMQQLVASLTHTKVGQDPGSWGIVCSLVNGQKGFRDKEPCTTCGEEDGTKKCSKCHFDAYCDKECQKLHWFLHKKYCKLKEAEFNALETSEIENSDNNPPPPACPFSF